MEIILSNPHLGNDLQGTLPSILSVDGELGRFVYDAAGLLQTRAIGLDLILE